MTDKKTEKLFHKAISAVKASPAGKNNQLGLAPGDRVQLHPATDLWMRGARYGEVVKVTNKSYHVRLDATGKVVRLTDRSIGEVVSRDSKMQPRTRLG